MVASFRKWRRRYRERQLESKLVARNLSLVMQCFSPSSSTFSAIDDRASAMLLAQASVATLRAVQCSLSRLSCSSRPRHELLHIEDDVCRNAIRRWRIRLLQKQNQHQAHRSLLHPAVAVAAPDETSEYNSDDPLAQLEKENSQRFESLMRDQRQAQLLRRGRRRLWKAFLRALRAQRAKQEVNTLIHKGDAVADWVSEEKNKDENLRVSSLGVVVPEDIIELAGQVLDESLLLLDDDDEENFNSRSGTTAHQHQHRHFGGAAGPVAQLHDDDDLFILDDSVFEPLPRNSSGLPAPVEAAAAAMPPLRFADRTTTITRTLPASASHHHHHRNHSLPNFDDDVLQPPSSCDVSNISVATGSDLRNRATPTTTTTTTTHNRRTDISVSEQKNSKNMNKKAKKNTLCSLEVVQHFHKLAESMSRFSDI